LPRFEWLTRPFVEFAVELLSTLEFRNISNKETKFGLTGTHAQSTAWTNLTSIQLFHRKVLIVM
jgi:hypothetical protein